MKNDGSGYHNMMRHQYVVYNILNLLEWARCLVFAFLIIPPPDASQVEVRQLKIPMGYI